ncbi:MAG: nitrite/sulfite reductase [Sphingomonadaceae bacterium]|uniref:nitrite/sulfite reductase n=1 Tax=Thermaurantiacus sp. TaxID=2820283 RepID=UPI00298EEB4C|nr:nitrite/sulfite reductase [Thermaurantiacus sp.]MCS6987751.1 nitrite/sulfite reductase [Sphingomonadaceae bacterium]MDW8415029.1 nitrite/sulfite reductase [Thermaurantiacus sp.]
MYRPDEIDRAIVDARVAEFRDQVARRLSGELDEDHFKPLRLKNGLYLQLHAYMLRVAIPYGVLSAEQLRMLADVARRYDRGYGHFTTRQNIQFNWVKLEEAPDLLADLARVGLHAIQTSGNCVRNITSDPYAGAAADEVVDPRPWAELLRQWSTLHPEFSYLPRKFKIAITGAPVDRAAIRFHDIGLELRRLEGRLGLKVYVGGGMGRTPMLGACIRDFLPAEEFLSYCEAILRVYNRHGRRDNIHKARIKILVQALGAEQFAAEVEREHAHLKGQGIDAPWGEVERIAAHFTDPPFTLGLPDDFRVDALDPGLERWVARQVMRHRVPGYRIVNVSLKPPGGIPGDASAEQMEAIAELADAYSFGEVRVTHAQNLVLPHVRAIDIPAVYRALMQVGLAEANLDLASDIICCPGLDYCTLANARSIPVAQALADRLRPIEAELGELKIKVSGCINACGHHHAGHIGILGVDRKGTENYQLLLGGSGAEDASLAQILGPGFTAEGVVEAVARVVDVYRRERAAGERFLDTYRRLGPAPFREAVYG